MKKDYKNECENGYYVDETNAVFGSVVRWVSSNNIPHEDILTEFLLEGYVDSETVVNSIYARRIEDNAELRSE